MQYIRISLFFFCFFLRSYFLLPSISVVFPVYILYTSILITIIVAKQIQAHPFKNKHYDGFAKSHRRIRLIYIKSLFILRRRRQRPWCCDIEQLRNYNIIVQKSDSPYFIQYTSSVSKLLTHDAEIDNPRERLERGVVPIYYTIILRCIAIDVNVNIIYILYIICTLALF